MAALFPVLLAGGSGSRLWPLSREFYPKQLLNLTGRDSLLQQVARRALGHAPVEQVITITSESHYFSVLDQLGEVDPHLPTHLVLEPASRDTAAAVILAALYARDLSPDALLWTLPADHVLTSPPGLGPALAQAITQAEHGWLVSLVVASTHPHWRLPILERRLHLADGIFSVGQGDHTSADPLFMTGMCVIPASLLLERLTSIAPDLLAQVTLAWQQRKGGPGPVRVPPALWKQVPALPLSQILLSRGETLAAVPLVAGWADVSSWQSLWEIAPKDPDGNVVEGDVILAESQNCLIRADGRLVACAGVKDLTVVETADAVLVAHRHELAGLLEVVRQLKSRGRPEANAHLRDRRPWGSYSVLLEGPRYKIKEIEVKPGASLSLQMHHHRSEHWVVIAGTAKVVRGEDVEFLAENQSTYIPVATRHRLENPGKIPLRIIEVQLGSYVGEDDIVRFEDTYGRNVEE